MEERSNFIEPAIKDRFYLNYILFYLLGMLSGVPSNFFMTATDFWMYKFRDTSDHAHSDTKTALQKQFLSMFNIVVNVINVLFFAVTILYLSKRVGSTKRMIGAFSLMLLMFGVTVLFATINTDSWQTAFFWLVLLIGCVITASSSIFIVTIFEMGSKFPPEYLASVISGQAICGIVASLTQIGTLSVGAGSRTNGLIYFLIGMFLVVVTLILYLGTVKRSLFFQFYDAKEVKKQEMPKVTLKRVLGVLNSVKFYLISMVISSGATVMLHPGVESLVVSTQAGSQWTDVYFIPVTCFLLHNTFDFIGREAAAKLQKPKNGVVILAIGVVRVALVPLIMLCNIHPRNHLPLIFHSDYEFIVMAIILALSNGFIMNLCVTQIPKVTDPENIPLAMLVFMVIMYSSMVLCSLVGAALVNAL